MSTPEVTINELDGQTAVLPAGQRALAIVGVADAGDLDTPVAFTRKKGVIAEYSAGPLVQAAGYWIQNYRLPALTVRTGAATVGTHTGLVTTGVAGTSVVTIDAADQTPNDDYEPHLEVVTGGTIGTPGITFKWSLDNGRTQSPVTALGAANTFAFPGSGGIGYDFAAGTLLAGDVARSVATAPRWNTTELGTALAALQNSPIPWDVCYVTGSIDATAFDALVSAFASMPDKMWIGGVRMPNVGESEATYLTSLVTAFGGKASNYPGLCAGAARIISGIDSRAYRRSAALAVATRCASVSEEVNAAEIDLGALPGVGIRDENGNPIEHDEDVNPGLDDARFTVLRTHQEYQGVYINRPRIFSADGSDFRLVPHRRVMNLVKPALRAYFKRRLNKPIQVDRTTGFILEADAQEIESGADAVMRALLMAKPKASGPGLTAPDGTPRFVVVSRDDNLLTTLTMTVQAGIIPLSYPEAIVIDLGFKNPALQLVQV